MKPQRSKILIIDDEPTNIKIFGEVLSAEFELQVTTSGAVGLNLAEQSSPDLILLDVLMPDMDGYETCRRIKANPNLRHIPIIFVTAMGESDAENEGLALGAADYLTKPLNLEIARQRIRNLLERERLYKEVENYRKYLEELVQIRTKALSIARAHSNQLEGIAYYDPLTGVPNRRLLMDRLYQAVAHARRSKQLLAVCYFDLDGFKPINDELGHDAGDQLLMQLTKRLQGILRQTDTLARIGGDEFVLLLGDIEEETKCYEFLNGILNLVSLPFMLKNRSVAVSASLGITFFPIDETNDTDLLLNHADEAMYRAKREGKNRFVVYTMPRQDF